MYVVIPLCFSEIKKLGAFKLKKHKYLIFMNIRIQASKMRD